MKTPIGFQYAGLEAGIKPSRKDLALVYSETPCAAAGCLTQNKASAAPIQVAREQLPSDKIQAVIVNSGNANALTGPQGLADVRTVMAELAAQLRIPTDAVVTASTGVIGHRLPVQKIVTAVPRLAQSLSPDPLRAAEAILTTDTRVKMADAQLTLGGREVTIAAICKGSGMIAPELATMIAVITTDAAIAPKVLQASLTQAMQTSFNALTVDGDMSTNDVVFALANGRAGNATISDPGKDLEAFQAALTQVCKKLAKEIAADGEGATKLLDVTVKGATSDAIAMDLCKAVAGGSLVKAAIFGADPNWGRILAAVGARCGTKGLPFDAGASKVTIQDVAVYAGEPLGYDASVLKARMRAPEVKVLVELGQGAGEAQAWGCDLSYDYVKINADYTSLIVQTPDGGVAKDDRLANYSPKFKASLLVEALSYISRFSRTRAVIKFGGAGMVKDSLKASFANDINLLRSAGLLPIVVHGGGPEITSTMASLGRVAEFVDGVRITGREDVKVVEMVLTGRVNTELVSLLNRSSAHAVGVSGKDAGLLRVRKLAGEGGRDLGMVGVVTHVNHELLEVLLDKKYVPVVSPVGLGEDGEGYNINADSAASEIAIALKAEKLIYLTDVAGILVDGELVSEMSASALRAKLADGTIRDGMVEKARSVLRAIEGGVPRVHILDGRTPHSVIAELFTDRGVGTLVHAD